MAQKKTVSISRKPSTAGLPAIVGELAAAASPPPSPATLKPNGGSDTVQAPTLGPLGTAVYGTVYCLSYGVMFSVILLGACIPGSALIGRAWQDGSRAARRGFGRVPA
ncbi:MAG: hypothetical protein ACRERU_13300 [Methylococcales bacterium]